MELQSQWSICKTHPPRGSIAVMWTDHNIECPLPPRPTTALPGTRAKIRVMARRVARDYQPFHPRDAKYDDAASDQVVKAMVEIAVNRARPKGRRKSCRK